MLFFKVREIRKPGEEAKTIYKTESKEKAKKIIEVLKRGNPYGGYWIETQAINITDEWLDEDAEITFSENLTLEEIEEMEEG